MIEPKALVKQRVLKIELEDGRLFQVPLEIIAQEYGEHQNKISPGCYQEEFDWIMSDLSEKAEIFALQFYQEHMSPASVAPHAKLVYDGQLTPLEFLSHYDEEDVYIDEVEV